MSPESEKRLAEFKAKWIGKHVKIVGIDHPWRGETGYVDDVTYGFVGWGMSVRLENNAGFAGITKGSDIKVI